MREVTLYIKRSRKPRSWKTPYNFRCSDPSKSRCWGCNRSFERPTPEDVNCSLSCEMQMIQRVRSLKGKHKSNYRRILRRAMGSYPRDWHVHHIDGNHYNNTPHNLIALPEQLHMDLHHSLKWRKNLLPNRAELEVMLGRLN